MRSFFKRPSWASRSTEDSTSDFYRRSEQTYGDIIAATKEEREREATNSAGDYPEENNRANKHRRVSNQAYVKDKKSPDFVNGGQNEGSGAVDDLKSSTVTSPEGRTSDARVATREHSISRQSSSKSDTRGESNDADDVRFVCDRGSSPLYEPSYEKGKFYDQSASQSHEERENASVVSGNSNPEEPSSNETRETKGESTKNDTNTQEDDVVQILITSEIENTKPLIVHRKVSQSLKEVRLAWCKRQGFTEGMQSTVFLIWKGRRLFDVTTCRTLGVKPMENSSDSFTRSSFDDQKTKRIHMEAVTEDVLASRRQQKQPHVPVSESQTDSGSSDEGDRKENSLIKVILKCPGLVDYGIKVTQETEVSYILTTYRKAQHIPTEKEVCLIFDGERLEPDSRLSDYEIADLDLVDVLVK